MCEKGKKVIVYNKDEAWKIGEHFSCDPNKIIHRLTTENSITFESKTKNGLPIALKRFQLVDINTKNLQKFKDDCINRNLDHPNILKYLHCVNNNDFVYLVAELCAVTLEDYIKGVYKGPFIGTKRDITLQMTEGLGFLHNNGITHGDIKPTNIFISIPSGMNDHPKIKLGDFCIRSTLILEQESTDLFMPKARKKSLLDSGDAHASKGDIFSMGLVFCYFLSGGVHPFGETALDRSSQSDEINGPYRDYDDLICMMCHMNPEQRPTAQEVLEYILTKTRPSFGIIEKNYECQERRGSTKDALEDEGIGMLTDDAMNISTDSVEVGCEEIYLPKSINNKSIENTYKKTKGVSKLPSRKSPRLSKRINTFLTYFQKRHSK